MADKADAIRRIFKDSDALPKFMLVNDDLTWLDEDVTKPTDSLIEETIATLNAEEESNAHQMKRRNEYPSIGDQLDDLFHAGAFSDEMTAKIQAVKDKFPKGE